MPDPEEVPGQPQLTFSGSKMHVANLRPLAFAAYSVR